MAASVAIAVLALVLTHAPGAIAAERDRYIVVFENSVEHPAHLARAQVEQRNGKLGFVYRVVLNGYSAELPVQAVEGLRRDPRVKYVVIDGEVAPFAQTTPTGVSRVFASANKALDIDSVDDARVDADIAVIDTGVDYTHPDLNVVARTDCSNGTEKEAKCIDSTGTDTVGHGTHVAGIAAAIDNGFGVVGTAPGARIWAVKVLETGTNWTSEILAGIDWVTAKRKDGNPENDIEVINMSLGCPVNPLCPTAPMDEAITKSVEAGVVVVVAAGNEKADAKNYTPANSPNAITVSALADVDGEAGGKKGATTCTDDFPGFHATRSITDDTFASIFSNYGATVEIAAPGVCILSTYPGNEYKKASGTSMAAPHVSGAAAVLAAQDQPESKADVEAIRETLLKAGNSGWTDISGDGVQEPLLDMSNELIFHGGPRITAVVTTTGKLYAKVGSLAQAWVEITPAGITATSVSVGADTANGPVIGIIGSDGHAYVKQGLYGTWVDEYAGAKTISVASDSKNGPVIGIIANNEKAYAKQGLAGAWVEEYAGAKTISVASDSKNGPVIGIIANNEKAYAKQGLAGAWVEEYAGAKTISVASDSKNGPVIGIIANNEKAYAKQGLAGAWVEEYAGAKTISVASDSKNGPVIGIIANNEKAYAKQGLAGAWVEEYAGAKTISVASNIDDGPRIGVEANNGHAYVKQGLLGAWADEYEAIQGLRLAE